MQDNKNKNLDIIGYDCGWGTRDFGCEDGPAHLEIDQLLEMLHAHNYKTSWQSGFGLRHLAKRGTDDAKEQTLSHLAESLSRLSHAVSDSLHKKRFPVVVGGDHSSGIATWSAAATTLRCQQHFGLVWIDAHLDCHTYKTSWQGKFGGWWHGQVLPALCGYGLPQLTQLNGAQSKLNPQHITIIGGHSFEPAEIDFIKRHGVRLYTLDDVNMRGFRNIFNETIEHLERHTDSFGVSIDLDVFQPKDAPGVGASEEKGLVAADVLPALDRLFSHNKFAALEIAEFNPHKDINGRTEKLIRAILDHIFS